jgi:hypothetical protein
MGGKQGTGQARLRRVVVAVTLLLAAPALSQDVRYLSVGTGPPGENHFPLGGAIVGAISSPPGLPPCGRGSNCGVPGLIAVASATAGSVADVDAIGEGRMDAALVQADIPVLAAAGLPPFAGRPIRNVRAVADLYVDQLHLVVLRDGPIRALRDLRGKRVSLGEIGSGTLVHARLLLAALGLKESDIKADNLRSEVAADAMLAGGLDAFFVLDGPPVPSVAELARNRRIRLIPIAGPAADRLRSTDPLLTAGRITAGLYDGVTDDVPTVAIGVTLVVSAALPDDLVYGITKALWQPGTVRMLADRPPGGVTLTIGQELAGQGVPLHPGARRFYTESGIAN